ncbi:NB-ARC domain, LRR domain containing protein [Trema orientale]|uniref:NB-ARC domain, LRR domain containing protein n=1 Tax=Trema orientale TaxID=63057 RepID=A0A2P5FR10_TREOI|nr:NB-ARC domain, LRR domain containing protein [Trema orientale]
MEIASFIKDCIELLWDPISRQYNNLRNYRASLESLEDKAERLKARQEDVEASIKAAESRKQVIKNEVREWTERAGELLNKSKSLLEDQARENKRCCGISGCFPDYCWRSKMSKSVVERASAIDSILGEQRFERVSIVPPRTPSRGPAKFEWSSSMGMEKFQLFSSTESTMNNVAEALRDDEIGVIGVHGIGGVGKTTMVKQVAEKALKEGLFGHVVMATVSQTDHNLIRRVQDQIAEGFGLTLGKDTQKSIASQLKRKIMEEKSVLIILDDVWKTLDLGHVGIPYGTELENCKSKILLTTRLEHVCHRMKCQRKIRLQHLSEPDSWEFFKITAGTNFDSPEFEAVGRLIAKECGGLPIALIAVAKALGDKDVEEWHKAHQRLKRSMPVNGDDDKTVFNCIKLSYDFLESQEKACFLIFCLFPEDHSIENEEIARYGMGMGLFQDVNTMEEARGYASTIAKKLIASGLLLDGDKERAKMHDVIRDVAILITSTSRTNGDHQCPEDQHIFLVQAGLALKEWPRRENYGKYTAISLMSNEVHRLPDGVDCPKLQALFLQDNNNLKEIPSTFFKMMSTLRVLDLNGIQASSLPSSIELLMNLRVLSLDRSQFKDIALLGSLEKLEILSLREISLIYTLPENLKRLSKLRMLDLTLSNNIKIPANLMSRLSYLEEFYLKGGFNKWEDDHEIVGGSKKDGTNTSSTACFGEIIDLPCLTILKADIKDIKCLPRKIECVPNWLKFNICICREEVTRILNALPSKQTTSGAVYSRNLLLDITINNLPDWFVEVVTGKTDKIIYAECYALNMVEEFKHGKLTGLKSLVVEQCPEVYSLMHSVDGGSSTVSPEPLFEILEELRTHHMDFMTEICIGELPRGSLARLKFLEVQQCYYLKGSLLRSNLIKRLHSLDRLWVNGNSVKEVFGFEGLGLVKEEEGELYLGKLREIRLENLSELTNIWKGPVRFANFANLKLVTVIKCKVLRDLFSVSSIMSQGFSQMEVLWVEECLEMVEIVSNDPGIAVDKVELPKLKTLCLINLPKLTSFCPGSATLECPSLEHLHLQECQNFRIATSDFHSSKPVQEIDENNLKLLKKR